MTDIPSIAATGNVRPVTVGALAAALALAQGEMAAAVKGRTNPFFKSRYSTLSDIWDVCREPLSKNGLAVMQLPSTTADGICIKTILMHSSGESMESEFTMPLAKKDAQGIGSAITYGRRYALAAICGVVSDEDDDGNAATSAAHQNRHASTPPPNGRHEQRSGPTTKDDILASVREMVAAGGKADLDAAVERAGVKGIAPNALTEEQAIALNNHLPAPWRVKF